MKNVQSIWFNPMGLLGQIGIVWGEDEQTGKRKAYIGIGFGLNEQADEERILKTGDKLPAEMAERIAAWLNEEPSTQIENSDLKGE